jgi:hypothetical protein
MPTPPWLERGPENKYVSRKKDLNVVSVNVQRTKTRTVADGEVLNDEAAENDRKPLPKMQLWISPPFITFAGGPVIGTSRKSAR